MTISAPIKDENGNTIEAFQITYQDLIDDVYKRILSMCQNIDSFKNVPASLKQSSQYTIASTVIKKNTLTVQGTNTDSKSVVVSRSVVKKDLDNFLASRGLASKSNEVITFKGMMNFYNNIASFFATRIIFMATSFESGTCIFYNNQRDGVTYPSVTSALKDKDFTPDQIKTSLDEMLKAINSKSKTWYPATTLSYTCSSSSSSSSSSSCSSSSSMFIAYMEV